MIARTGEHRPSRAVALGHAVIARHVARGAKPKLRRLGPLLASACEVALAVRQGTPIEREEDLRDFAQFVRCTASLRHLMPLRAFDPLARGLIAKADPEFAHDEYVAFVAAQLFAGGLAVRPPAHTHRSTLDLRVDAGMLSGKTLFFECKERNPTASREPGPLLSYIESELAGARGQLAGHARGTRGIACVDLGVVTDGADPAEADVLALFRRKLARGPLIGILLSSTRLVISEDDQRFVPVFRSGLYLSRRLRHEHDCALRPNVLEALVSALRFVHPVPL